MGGFFQIPQLIERAFCLLVGQCTTGESAELGIDLIICHRILMVAARKIGSCDLALAIPRHNLDAAWEGQWKLASQVRVFLDGTSDPTG